MVWSCGSNLHVLWLSCLLQKEVEPGLGILQCPETRVFILEWIGVPLGMEWGPVRLSGMEWGPVRLSGMEWGPVRLSGMEWGPVRLSGMEWGPVRVSGLERNKLTIEWEKWNGINLQ